MTLHVCFVCSGNICRSPTAAAVYSAALRDEGLDGRVRVSSAGLGPWHAGEPIDERAGAVLRAAGYRVDHVAAQLDADHAGADLLLAMDSGHLRALREAVGAPDRVRMFRDFDPLATDADTEVGDPYYGGRRGFDTMLDTVRRCMPGLLDWTRAALRCRAP